MNKLMWSLVLGVCLLHQAAFGMEHYSDVLKDSKGNSVKDAAVYVYNAGTTNLATIYADNGINLKANPFTTSSALNTPGALDFYAANGAYDIVFIKAGYSFDALLTRHITIFDPTEPLGLAGGGTNNSTFTAGKCVRSKDDGTGLESAPEDCGTGSGGSVSITVSGGVESSSGSPITGTGTIRGNVCVNPQTGTTYTVVSGDRGCVVTFANADTVLVTLPQAGGAGFDAGFFFYPVNLGPGQVVITPSTSTIQGAAELTIEAGRGTQVVSDGTNYVHMPGNGVSTESQTLQSAFSFGKAITGANSEANCFRAGTTTQYFCIFWDSVEGLIVKPQPLADTILRIWPGQTLNFLDVSGTGNMAVWNPAAGTKNAMYSFGTNYKPLASLYVPLEADTGATAMTLTNPVTSQPKAYWGTLTDSNSDGFSFHFPVTGKMVGASTLTVRLWAISTTASPSGNIALDCAAKSYRPGTDTDGAHDTTGEQSVTLTPAVQNREVTGVTSAITINGTVAEHAMIIGACQVNATGTTSAQLANFFLRGEAEIQLLVNSLSD